MIKTDERNKPEGKPDTVNPLDILNSLPTFNDLDENKPMDWLVENLVPAKSITAVYSKRGLGKSHILGEGKTAGGFRVKGRKMNCTKKTR
jgi:hypothetical protein